MLIELAAVLCQDVPFPLFFLKRRDLVSEISIFADVRHAL
jgi:hypothetical protein